MGSAGAGVLPPHLEFPVKTAAQGIEKSMLVAVPQEDADPAHRSGRDLGF